MKKKTLFFVIFLVLLVTSETMGYTSSKDIEKPDVRLVINGKLFSLKGIPVLMNGKILLPLTDMTSALGIPNDKQHAIWNSAEKSIMLITDNTKIYLKINDSKAIVNNNEMKTDICPIIYRSIPYIPLSFVADCFGKKVAWDTNSNTITICNLDNYITIKSIINKCISNMNTLRKYEFTNKNNSDFKYVNTGLTSKTHNTNHHLWDSDKKVACLSIESDCNYSSGESTSFKLLTYMADGKLYTKANNNPWELDTSSDVEKVDYFSNDFRHNFDRPIYYSGLIKTMNPESSEILLVGDIINIPEADKCDKVIACQTKIIIDADSYLIKQITSFSETNIRYEGKDYLIHYTNNDDYYSKLDDNFQIPNPITN